MKTFFYFSLAYAVASSLLALVAREQAMAALNLELMKLVQRAWMFSFYLQYLAVFIIALLYFLRRSNLKARLINVGYAFIGCLIFAAAFSITKTTIPFMVPFYADTVFADLDKFLHLGVDPWVITHQASAYVTPTFVETVYFTAWFLPAFFLPVFIALTDSDEDRSNRFMILYCTCWILLGNVLALTFCSVGPVYYDLLLGGDRFVGLTSALASSGITESNLGQAQAFLWHDYTNQAQTFGAGISAFPSVHVGIATVVALYLAERSAYLVVPGLAFLLAVLFCSVYNGWHYAVDGYASIVVITVVWSFQRHRKTALRGLTAPT